MVPKAFKEVKQQVDIVGKGRGDHGDSSWKGFAVFSRRTCHYRLCQVIYAHPSVKYYSQLVNRKITAPHGLYHAACRHLRLARGNHSTAGGLHPRCYTGVDSILAGKPGKGYEA